MARVFGDITKGLKLDVKTVKGILGETHVGQTVKDKRTTKKW